MTVYTTPLKIKQYIKFEIEAGRQIALIASTHKTLLASSSSLHIICS